MRVRECSAADTTVKQKAGSVLVPSRAAAMLTAGLQSLADPALDLFHSVDKVNAVGVVLRKTRGDGQHVTVADHILRRGKSKFSRRTR